MADAQEETLTLAPGATWSDDIAAELSAVASEVAPLDWWRREIERGAWHLLHVAINGRRVGCVVYRIDKQPIGYELVVVGAYGRDDRPLTPRILPLLEAMAKAMGCVSSRIHTRRLGLVAVLKEQGYERAEWVMRRML